MRPQEAGPGGERRAFVPTCPLALFWERLSEAEVTNTMAFAATILALMAVGVHAGCGKSSFGAGS